MELSTSNLASTSIVMTPGSLEAGDGAVNGSLLNSIFFCYFCFGRAVKKIKDDFSPEFRRIPHLSAEERNKNNEINEIIKQIKKE